MYKTVIAPESSVSAPVSFLSSTPEALNSAIEQTLLPHQRPLSSQLPQPRSTGHMSAAGVESEAAFVCLQQP